MAGWNHSWRTPTHPERCTIHGDHPACSHQQGKTVAMGVHDPYARLRHPTYTKTPPQRSTETDRDPGRISYRSTASVSLKHRYPLPTACRAPVEQTLQVYRKLRTEVNREAFPCLIIWPSVKGTMLVPITTESRLHRATSITSPLIPPRVSDMHRTLIRFSWFPTLQRGHWR